MPPYQFAGSSSRSRSMHYSPPAILKPHKYNLSAAEMSVALSATGDNRVDDATREQDYARGKQLMLERRAAGYRDEADYQGKR